MDTFSQQLSENLVAAINQKYEPIENTLQLNWSNPQPLARANQLAQILGPPSTLDPRPDGRVIWEWVDPFLRQAYSYIAPTLKSTQLYSKLMIKDQQIPHLVPVPHTDWFYAYMYIDIPSERVDDVRKLTESLGYDTLSKELYARCHFMPANLTTLFLAKQIALGHKSLDHAMQEYSSLIPTLAKEEQSGQGLLDQKQIGPWHYALTQYTFGLSD